MWTATVAAGRAEVVEGAGYDVLERRAIAGDAERAGLQAAHVEQVGDQPGESVEGLVGGGQQFLAVVVVEVDVGAAQAGTAAFAEASGVRRSWLTAASSAVRIRSASARGLAAAASAVEPFLAQRDGGLGGERLDDAPVAALPAGGRAAAATGRRRTG